MKQDSHTVMVHPLLASSNPTVLLTEITAAAACFPLLQVLQVLSAAILLLLWVLPASGAAELMALYDKVKAQMDGTAGAPSKEDLSAVGDTEDTTPVQHGPGEAMVHSHRNEGRQGSPSTPPCHCTASKRSMASFISCLLQGLLCTLESLNDTSSWGLPHAG